MKKNRRNILFGLLLTGVLVLAGGKNVYAADGSDADYRIPEGVVVNHIDISGMTVKDAEQQLKTLTEEVLNGTLTLKVGDAEAVIPYRDFNLHVADSHVIEEICKIGTKGNLVKRYKELADVKNNKAEYLLPFGYDQEKLKTLIDETTAEYESEPQNASLVRESGEFTIIDDVIGREINVDATADNVKAILGEKFDGSNQSTDAVVVETEAKHKSDELKNVTDRLGSYSTTYAAPGNRASNIANGASFLDGTIIYPGETFSFLDCVTPITYANGYYQATGYSGGKVVPSVGGGICQVSSTLYNVVLRSELEIVERYNHGLTVGYVPLGADATVAENAVDFRFRNNLEAPVYIEAYTYGGEIYISMYGHETRSAERSIEFYSVTEQTIAPGADVVTKDESQPEGWQEVTQSAHNGYVASFYKYVYNNGELEDKILINTSRYSAAPRYVTVGAKKPETEAPETSESNKDTAVTEPPIQDEGATDGQ